MIIITGLTWVPSVNINIHNSGAILQGQFSFKIHLSCSTDTVTNCPNRGLGPDTRIWTEIDLPRINIPRKIMTFVFRPYRIQILLVPMSAWMKLFSWMIKYRKPRTASAVEITKDPNKISNFTGARQKYTKVELSWLTRRYVPHLILR